MTAVVIGAVQFLSPKGTNSHRLLGYVWVSLIITVCITSFGIFTIRLVGPFSPIHLLSILTIHSAITSVLAIRRGDVEKHMKSMKVLYILALLLTGGFTLYPGRIMNQVLFG